MDLIKVSKYVYIHRIVTLACDVEKRFTYMYSYLGCTILFFQLCV